MLQVMSSPSEILFICRKLRWGGGTAKGADSS